jgi:hypothetical protein
VVVEYGEAKKQVHQDIRQILKQRRVLEKLQHFLQVVRLPQRLTLKFDECVDEADASYEESTRTITICYELIVHLQKAAPKETTPNGVTPRDAVLGPIIEILLHETGHALFHILKIPVLGREEDAADQVAAYLLLQFGKEAAVSTIRGAAYMYAREAQEKLDPKALAGVHSLSAQRFYNIMCMAYGADPRLFGELVDKELLPDERAEGCRAEYLQVDYAMRTLLGPHIDRALAVSRKAEWRGWRPAPLPPPGTTDKSGKPARP